MGYDQDRFAEEIMPDLCCLICSEVLQDPVECAKCQTNFCKTCIDDWSSRKSECPNRCQLVLQAPHRFLRTTLGQLKIKCSHEGCEKVVTLEKLQTHEDKECEFRQVACQNEGCGQALHALNFKSHAEECSYRIIICEKCSLDVKASDLALHDCINALSEIVRRLLRVNEEQQNRIDALETVLNVRSSNFIKHDEFEHPTECSVCRRNPIIRVKYRCRLCPNYQVCEGCLKHPHSHADFVQMTFSGSHEEIRCDECKVYPIEDLRYKCGECGNFDLCQTCKLNVGHIHALKELRPIWVKVVPYVAERLSYRVGQDFKREWEVTNLGQEPITNISMLCVAGFPCFNETVYSFGVTIAPGARQKLTLKAKVTSFALGSHKSKWRLFSPETSSLFGEELAYELVVV
mmetsp:Transcript_15782/g.28831  ORF Transcript_15782/g.28831 Transcript_15782/m.28831 type:complete len:403 (-) Transcript_15782:34-1242(-)